MLAIDDDNNQNEEPRQIVYQDVDPFEAGWETLIAFRSKYRYCVFFENDIGLKNGFQMDLLRGWLEDKCGVEGEHWELRQSDFPMEQLWNRSQDSEERRMYGNHVYLTDVTWLVNEKLIADPSTPVSDSEVRYTASRITVVQTRK